MKRSFAIALSLLFLQLNGQDNNYLATNFAQSATILTSSGENPKLAVDEHIHTFWESEPPLPENYINNPDLNAYHPKAAKKLIVTTNAATDANLNTAISVNSRINNEDFAYSIKLDIPVKSRRLSIKTGGNKEVYFTIHYTDGSHLKNTILPKDQYTMLTFFPDSNKSIRQIQFVSVASFQIFEIACLSQKPFVEYTLQLNSIASIGQIYSRHFNPGPIESISYLGSTDGITWKTLGKANPKAIGMIPFLLKKQTEIRYFKLRFALSDTDYAKAMLWELKLFDQYGPFGKPMPSKLSDETLENRIGLNMVWGWGQQQYSDQIPSDKGWKQYKGIFKKLRLYHYLYWDIHQPGTKAGYAQMSEKGTTANWWLNWDREYNFLNQQGFDILLTLLFKNSTFPDSVWKNPKQEAFAIGDEFAGHFGASGLAEAVEAGNEPWDYQPVFYRETGTAMMEGFNNGNSNLKRLPAAFQSTFKQYAYDDLNNFFPDYSTAKMLSQSDALNIHLYSYANDSLGEYIALPPEDPRSPVNSIRNMLRYRNKFAPHAEVWVTEFGYDSDGAGEACHHSNCIDAQKQAAWGIRGVLKLLKEGADRVYWYFYANEATDSYLHSRSGLTASASNDYKPKPLYHAFKTMMETLRNTKLASIVEENSEYSIYEFVDQTNGDSFLVAWMHHYDNPEFGRTIDHQIFKNVTEALMLSGETPMNWESTSKKSHQQIYGYPTIFRLRR